MQLSVVIVNYNVCDLLLNAVASLHVAMQGIEGEIIVVDNASSDGAITTLNRLHPDVITIQLDHNLGFGAANNIGIERAHGEYILLLNPDTIVQEDTIRVMMEFMESHPDATFAGCKIYLPSGELDPVSKRGFPSPWSSFCRVFGLSKLFPKSRFFGGYNLTYLDPEETAAIDALAGCFMFCRAEELKSLGGFDTDFFMYGEDLDLCYRARQAGGTIYYVPATAILHRKGESTRRSAIDALAVFYEAMEIFAHKHFRRNRLTLWLIRIGIRLRRLIARVQEQFPNLRFAAIDIIGTLLGLALGSTIRFGDPFVYPLSALPIVYIVPPLVFVATIAISGGYGALERLLGRGMFGYLLGFFVLSTLPYFFKDYAFSRGVVIATTAFATFFGMTVRFLGLLYRRTFGDESIRRVAFLSRQSANGDVRRAVRRMFLGRPITVVGTIAPTFSESEQVQDATLGSVENIAKIVRQHRLSDIVVMDETLNYSEVLKAIHLASGRAVRFHIVRGEFDVVEELPDTSVRFRHSSPAHDIRYTSSLAKRLRDRLLAIFMMVFILPIVYLSRHVSVARVRELWEVVIGTRLLVGGGAHDPGTGRAAVFTVADLCHDETLSQHDIAQVEHYYATNQSLLLDCEIMITAFRLRGMPSRTELKPRGERLGERVH
jgi:GT2 family glycosyltransferase